MKKNIKKTEPVATRRAIYTIEFKVMSDGKTSLARRNDGFNALELLGLLDLSAREIKDQMSGLNRPDSIKRQVVKD